MSAVTREQSLNVPNAITIARLALSLVLFGLMSAGVAWIWCAGLFVFAVLTDILDGWIARRWQLITTLGRILDPFADKFITGGAYLFLLIHPASGVNPWMVLIVLGREMLVTSLRGYLEQRGADFSASVSGKLKMFLQCLAVTLAMLSLDPLFAGATFNVVRDVSLWAMVAVTVWSGYIYVLRAIKLIGAGL